MILSSIRLGKNGRDVSHLPSLWSDDDCILLRERVKNKPLPSTDAITSWFYTISEDKQNWFMERAIDRYVLTRVWPWNIPRPDADRPPWTIVFNSHELEGTGAALLVALDDLFANLTSSAPGAVGRKCVDGHHITQHWPTGNESVSVKLAIRDGTQFAIYMPQDVAGRRYANANVS
jgi:hypothetical protein